jgi:S-(hydroxymethyl)glutathione dehydrogenase/alcohol dehydrogenase
VEPFVGLGGFAELLLVHERTLVRLPDEMPLDKASLLGCAGITGLGAVRHAAGVQAGDTVAVIGCGGVGLNAIQGARLCGASRIIAIDRLPQKLELAKVFGATDVVDASDVDPVQAVLELTGGGVDHALEVVGIEATIEQAFAMLDTMGTATVVGVARPEMQVRIPAVQLLLEKRLQGTKMGSTRFRLDVPLYCQMYMDGRLLLDELLSDTKPLSGVNEALDRLDNPTGARTVLTF